MKASILPLFLLLALVFGLPASAEDKKPEPKEPKLPEPKLPLGKDTTYVTGPLDKHGYIDYEAALNAEMSKGITVEKNAMALLTLALGPTPEGSEMPPAYYKWLDIGAPPKEGNYIISMGEFLRTLIGMPEEQRDALFEFQGRAGQRPWVPKDCPPLAEWLKMNEKPLATVHEAVKRPKYFNPLCSRRTGDEGSNLIGALLPTVQKCREIASLLTSRAMLKIGEKKFDAAWEDILACHRLARHVGHGATLIEMLVGVAIGQIANNATITYIALADLTPKQALARMKELQELPAMAAMADKIGISERMMGLDAVQLIRRNPKPNALRDIFDEGNVTEDELKAMTLIDWTPLMQTMNKWYDRMSDAMRIKDRTAREKEFDKLDAELREYRKEFSEPETLKKLLKEKDSGKQIGTLFGKYLMALLAPAVRKVHQAQDRITQADRNVQLAFAMAAYHKDNDRYPEKLADLAPKYIAAVPDDVFNGKPLIYKPSEKGYLFYSVGPNGKDDGGRWYNDDPPGDDPNVKMPLPELKKKK